jgi:hypothetical protein
MNASRNKKLQLMAYLGFIILISLGSIVTKLIVSDGEFLIKVVEKKGHGVAYPATGYPLKTFNEETRIYGQTYLQVLSNRNSLAIFFEPDFLIEDTVYAMLLISVCTVFLLRVRKMDMDKPFTPQFVEGIFSAAKVCIVFWALDYFRLFMINKYVLRVTDNQFKIEKVFIMSIPAVWFAILLFWLYKILKKAEVIQQEQELTV